MNTFTHQLRFTGRVMLALCLALPALAAELASFETPLFSGAGNCAFCHDPWNPKQAGQPGEAAVLATDWRATMMAHSSSRSTDWPSGMVAVKLCPSIQTV
jgi:hypothetical protein